ncbi:MAG: ABC transporter ATP-binding protein [Crenarchaeota archaeon]|nr:ABC transporter ATP-binding protein [Thermoproteota archaeon]
MSSYSIVVKDLYKRYGDIEALRGVSFTVRRGEIFGLLGPNGAGKTTTIHILTTIIRPTSGYAEVAGFDVVKYPDEVRKRIGVVFQDITLDLNLTVYENLWLHGKIYGIPGNELRRRIDEVLELIELKEWRDKLVKYLSGGMKRRVEIARALLHKPEILFLDEPTLGLDPNSRVKIWNYVRMLRKEHNITILLTTHYMEEAEQLCDRIAIIDRGKIVAEGSPDELKSIIGREIIYVKFVGTPPVPLLKTLEHVREVKLIEGGKLEIVVDNAPKALPEIIEVFHKSNVQIEEVSYKRPTLNDVFVYLTGRELREEESNFNEHIRMIMRKRYLT